MGSFIFKKAVDQSLLKDGTTIPKNVVNELLDNLALSLNRGENRSINVSVAGKSFPATLNWVGFKNSNRNVLQIRYSAGSEIAKKLREIFSHSNTLLSKIKELPSGEGKQLVVPAADREYVEVYAVEKDSFEFKCYPVASKKLIF